MKWDEQHRDILAQLDKLSSEVHQLRGLLMGAIVPDPFTTSAPYTRVLNDILNPIGIRATDLDAGSKAHYVNLAALRKEIYVGGPEGTTQVRITAEYPVRAQVYATARRRRGVAQFSANGFLTSNPPISLYCFVLLDPSGPRVWILRSDVLVANDAARRNLPVGGLEAELVKNGMNAHGSKPGSMRLWFSRDRSPYDPSAVLKYGA